MKVITFNSNFGNFAYEATITLPDVKLSVEAERMAKKGVGSDMYRTAGSSVEKSFEKEFPAVKERNKDIAPELRGRRAIPYSTATAAQFTEFVNLACAKLAKDEGEPKITVKVTGQYVYGDKDDSAGKIALGMAEVLKDNPAALAAMGVPEGTVDVNEIAKAISAFNAKFRKPRVGKEKKEDVIVQDREEGMPSTAENDAGVVNAMAS